MRCAPFPHQPRDLPAMTRDGNVFRNLFARQQGMVRVPSDTHRSRMPLRPVCRRRDELENLFDRLTYVDGTAKARHSELHPSYPSTKPLYHSPGLSIRSLLRESILQTL